MPQIVKKRRSGWAILAVGALVASLLAVGASPAAAIDEDSTPDNKAEFKACLGPALADHGFTDISDTAVADINCLAYYEITGGRTADAFDPNSNVRRSEMALFLSRAAGVMDVDLSGGDMDADFGDIAELSDDRQSAIAALARNGVMGGRDDMAFDPHGYITRAEMAVALVSLVAHASDEVRANTDSGLFELKQDDGTFDGPDDSFDDAYEEVSARINNAISAAYELGITTGTGDGTSFSPDRFVPRRNMATFIIRTLNHTNARPADVTAQVGGGEFVVSVRDREFAPVVNQAVDIFMISSSIALKAFKADGTCSSRVRYDDGSDHCKVDGADVVTLSDGNEVASLPDTADGDVTVWVWVGEIGDTFGNSTDYFELEVTQEAMQDPDPSRVTVSNDLDADVDFAHFGEAVTVTVQLQGDSNPDDDDTDTAEDDEYVSVAPTDKTTFRLTLNVHPGADTTTSGSVRLTNETLTIGNDGSVSFELKAVDPDPSEGNANTALTSPYLDPNQVTIGYALELTSEDHDPALTFRTVVTVSETTGSVTFSDVKPAPDAVSVDAGLFNDAPTSGSAGNAAIVTVNDQFGNPYRGARITITSDASDPAADVALPTRARVTGRSGTVRIGYSYEGGAGVQILQATYDPTPTDVDNGDEVQGSTTIFWVVGDEHEQTADDDDSTTDTDLGATGGVNVLSLDPAKGQIVVDVDDTPPSGTDSAAALNIEPASVSYDSNDYFFVDGTPSGQEDFLAALGKQLQKVADAEAVDRPALTPSLDWSNYIFDDESERTSFELTVPSA